MKYLEFISHARLAPYMQHTANDKRAIALHGETLQLGASLMAMIALFELALRNKTNRHLIEDFGDDQWLLPSSQSVPLESEQRAMAKQAYAWAQRAMYAKRTYQQKKAMDAQAFPQGRTTKMREKAVSKARQKLENPNHGQVLSQTTFAFWKKLYSSDYEQKLWGRSIKKAFPNKAVQRATVAQNLEHIYATRNRVAHHEPVHGERLQQAMEVLSFMRENLGANFQSFSQVQWLRLQTDEASFLRAWYSLER